MAKIIFQDLQIGSVSRSSGIFTGNNSPAGWRHMAKINEGFGKMSGETNRSENGIQIVMDNDLVENYPKPKRGRP
jgi:hypothetical protein